MKWTRGDLPLLGIPAEANEIVIQVDDFLDLLNGVQDIVKGAALPK